MIIWWVSETHKTEIRNKKTGEMKKKNETSATRFAQRLTTVLCDYCGLSYPLENNKRNKLKHCKWLIIFKGSAHNK